jgi:hypothetical protein
MMRFEDGPLCSDQLTGRRILTAHLADGSVYLTTADGLTIQLEPEGDCCANAFFQHVDCSEALTDAVVSEVQDLEWSSSEDGDSKTVDVWGHRIHTSRGICTFDMRTEHNGYYSGRLEARVVDGLPAHAKPLEDF